MVHYLWKSTTKCFGIFSQSSPTINVLMLRIVIVIVIPKSYQLVYYYNVLCSPLESPTATIEGRHMLANQG